MITKEGLIKAIEAARPHIGTPLSRDIPIDNFAKALMVEIAKLPDADEGEDRCPQCGSFEAVSAGTAGDRHRVICAGCGHHWNRSEEAE